jgi:RNA polymerase sigma-54 factor
MQQAMKLLALGRLELIAALRTELLQNPLLEEVDDSDLDSLTRIESVDFAQNWDMAGSRLSRDDDLVRVSFEETHPKSISLSEHLLWQIQMSPLNAMERVIASRLVHELSEDGFLDDTVDDTLLEVPSDARIKPDFSVNLIQETESLPKDIGGSTLSRLKALLASKPPSANKKANALRGFQFRPVVLRLAHELEVFPEWVESVRRRLIQLDPPGCGALTVREALLAQMRHGGVSQSSLQYVLIDRHMQLLARNSPSAVAQTLSVSLERLRKALKYISTLEPAPARAFTEQRTVYALPEVTVVRRGDTLGVAANHAGMPQLRLNANYNIEMQKHLSKPNATYLNERRAAAKWLIRSLLQRQRSIVRVAESIVKFQRDWFLGVGPLRPLVLRDVADDIEMHESTISRVTNGKYMATERGVFEFRYFFGSSIAGEKGAVSSEAVRDMLKKLVSREDPMLPLTDDALVRALRQLDMEVARRTVAKYRDAAGILPAHKRKRII